MTITLEMVEWALLEEVSRKADKPISHVIRVAIRSLLAKCEKRREQE